MVNETLARRYAVAIFSLARENGAIDKIGDDLQGIASALGGESSAHAFFVAPTIDRVQKERVLTAAFAGRVHDVALHALLLLVRKRRESLLGGVVAEYRKLQLAERGMEPLTLTTAQPLRPDELASMVGRLERLYQTKFDVEQVVDPGLIGGARIQMGDRSVDGTVAGRLEALARELFAST